MTIVLPNLSAGNFASVLRMVQKVGGTARLVDDPAELRSADRIILAGVGAFDNGMTSLREGGWLEPLHEAVLERRVPVLGICLGMQLLCHGSEEGSLPGLGWIDAEVKRLAPADPALKVPHMGWNTVAVVRPNPLLAADLAEQRFYFVHSYYVSCRDRSDVVALGDHGQQFDAALGRGNIHGVQFHPEKSHRFGMALMRNFVEMPC